MNNVTVTQLPVTRAHFNAKGAQGTNTRGKTAMNRLRRVDIFLLRYNPEIIKYTDGEWSSAYYVDVGYGAYPWTTMESAEKFWRINPNVPIMGIEIDNARVRVAQQWANDLVCFRQGGFNLPLKVKNGELEKVRLIRCFNVLRQCYEEEDVPKIHSTMASFLVKGGILIEGTSDPPGRVWVANILRRTSDVQITLEALVFSTNFKGGFDPSIFQPHLPKNFIHKMVPGEPIFEFFEAWKISYASNFYLEKWGTVQLFVGAALGLAEQGFKINTQKKWLRRGYLIWYLT